MPIRVKENIHRQEKRVAFKFVLVNPQKKRRLNQRIKIIQRQYILVREVFEHEIQRMNMNLNVRSRNNSQTRENKKRIQIIEAMLKVYFVLVEDIQHFSMRPFLLRCVLQFQFFLIQLNPLQRFQLLLPTFRRLLCLLQLE